jgi:putative Mg2+ transporter-C (MgtC) family protein
VLGLTTAATLWIAASIGMACGAGMFDIAFAGTCLAIITLVSIRVLERKVLPYSTKRSTRVKATITCSSEFGDKIQDYIIDSFQNISQLSRKTLTNDESIVKISCILEVQKKKPIKDLYKSFQKLEGIDSLSIQECLE